LAEDDLPVDNVQKCEKQCCGKNLKKKI